jgi:colanic acid/amylovoran biosynthesis glycosyltransferase
MTAPIKTTCIVHPNKSVYSETFIRSHIEHLPGNILVLHGTEMLWVAGPTGDTPVVSLPMRCLLRQLDALRRRVPVFSPPATPARRLDAYCTHALGRLLRARRADVVLAEYGTTGVRIMESCRRSGIPLVVHFHGADAHSRRILEPYTAEYRSLFALAGAVVAVSHTMENQLRALGAPPEKIYYNPCGVDLSLFQPARPGANGPAFIAVGRFVDKKAPHLLLAAFASVHAACPEARLIMIGDGRLMEACRQLARGLGLGDAVEFTGALDHPEIARRLCTARAFVQHSVTTAWGDSEGTPVSVLEAGAAGLPAISTRHAGIADAVVHGRTGLLVEEYDVAGMAECMLRLAGSPAEADALGLAARAHISANFSMNRSIQRLQAIIQEAVTAYRGSVRSTTRARGQ